MLETTILTLGQLTTNCYLVSDSDTQETLIIDPADEGTFITEKILELRLKPISIVLTHGHFDHVLACLELKLNFNIPILINQKDQPLFQKAPASAKHWLGMTVDPVPSPDKFIKEGDSIKIGSQSFSVIDTPGHTPGSICLYHSLIPIPYSSFSSRESSPILFSGDTLFNGDIGRTDLSYSDSDDLQTSLQKLWTLPPKTVVYPGHGEPTTIDQEKMLNLNHGQ